MTSPFLLRRALRLTALLAALPTLTPALATASTFTVDDDGADCPSASFASIQAAIDQAAPFDTIKICPGLYEERSTPVGAAASPLQAGAVNGLTITKQVTLAGAGADKVTIRPAPSLGTTLAGTAPYLRDGGGNVITVSRQTLGSTDDNEQFVDISGVTIESPDIYAEAGVAFFNASGAVRNSVVGPLFRAAGSPEEAARYPHGWGIVMTNSLQGAGQGTTRREVRVEDSEVFGFQAGGVLFDAARGPDGDPATTTRSGIRMYGYVDDASVLAGSGTASAGNPAVPLVTQYGIRYHAGARGAITDSEVIGQATGTIRPTAAVLLTDAETGPDPSNPAVRGFSMRGTSLVGSTNGLLNRNITNTGLSAGAPASAPGNWWGCAAGPVVATASNNTTGCQSVSGTPASAGPPPVAAAANVEFAPVLGALPVVPLTPGPTQDDPPTARISEPLDGAGAKVGEPVAPVVAAADDIGVKAVRLTAAGAPVGTVAVSPYAFSWTPDASVAGQDVPLVATVTDSAGQTATSTVVVRVAPLPVPPPGPAPVPDLGPAPGLTAPPTVSGTPEVGRTVTCLPGSWAPVPAAFSYVWSRAGTPIAGATGSTYTLDRASTGSTVSCAVSARSATGVAGAAATSAGVLVALAPLVTATSSRRQSGPAIVVTGRTLRPTAAGRLTLASVSCVKAGVARCSTTVTATLRIAGRTTRYRVVRAVGPGRTSVFAVPLSRSVRSALARAKTGALTVTTTASDASGFRGSSTATATVRPR